MIGCNEQPKDKTVVVETRDTTAVQQKTAPPLGAQNTEVSTVMARPMARALALAEAPATPDSVTITKSGDTIRYFSDVKTGSGTTTYSYTYRVPRIDIRYKGTTTTPVPPPPTSVVKFLTLPTSGPLDLSGQSGKTVENLRFVNTTDVSIKLYNGANNITIRNCFFNGSLKELVELENASNITIENCLFAKGLAGVYAVGSKNIKIINCQFLNMRIRRKSDGSFDGRGVFVQFNACTGGQLINCQGENFAGESDAEDMVSCFKSSDILIDGNIFRGSVVASTSTSGGGILIGDYGGSNITAQNNTLLTPGQYGMAVAGGTNMQMLNNKIYSDRNVVSNNPLYVWAQQGATCGNVIVRGNRVYWIDKGGSPNNGWNAGNCTNTIFEPPTPISLSQMGVPSHLISKVTEAELLSIRR